MMQLTEADPKGLIRESYAIDGITAAECRSIFLDWALSLPLGADTAEMGRILVGHYGAAQENHPMTQVLHAAITAAGSAAGTAQRRGGRLGRGGA